MHITSTTPVPFRSDDYFYLDPDMDDDMDYMQNANLADTDYQPNESESDYLMYPRSAETTTECGVCCEGILNPLLLDFTNVLCLL